MNRTAKGIITTALAGSLLAALTACGSTDAPDPAAAGNGAPSTASASATPDTGEREDSRGTFVRAITADTIEVKPVSPKDGQPTGEPNFTVRILGIDAPEAPACGGEAAMAEFDRLVIPNEFMIIRYEDLESPTDADGNTLARIITGAGVEQDLGHTMVHNGYAATWYPEGEAVPSVIDKYKTIEAVNIEDKRGIWAECEPNAS